MTTVLITGCSSGYGLETARHFHAQGWNVIATMRTPRAGILPATDRLRVLALDVTNPQSILAALEASGQIDVLVNNAGIGMFGAFEATPISAVRSLFETNTFGVMAMTQTVLPQFRARRSGVIVNVTSCASAPSPDPRSAWPSPLLLVTSNGRNALNRRALVEKRLPHPGSRLDADTGSRLHAD